LPRVALLDADRVLADLRTASEGLSAAEAGARLSRQGPNHLPQPRGPGLARQLFDQMFYFFAVMLWVAAGLAFVGGMPQLGVAIIVVIVLNGLFSFAQEYRAERAIRALSALLPETAVVRRDGRKTTVPASELVPGDIVLLREGDRVSADARVLQSAGLKVDNSMLTGESEPVPRDQEPMDRAPGDIVEATNMVFAGTFVTSGSATVAVAATGVRTRLGGISALTGQVTRRPTPFACSSTRRCGLSPGSPSRPAWCCSACRCCSASTGMPASCSPSASSWRWCPRACCPPCRCHWR
jgi:magnesium-transporting ATPase (P-type)